MKCKSWNQPLATMSPMYIISSYTDNIVLQDILTSALRVQAYTLSTVNNNIYFLCIFHSQIS